MRAIGCGVRRGGLSLAILALAAAPAWAQSSPSGPVSATPMPALPTVAVPAPPLEMGVAPYEAPADGPLGDRKIHGTVEASIGSNGYRQGAASVDIPLTNGEVSLAIDSSQAQYGRDQASRRIPAPTPTN